MLRGAAAVMPTTPIQESTAFGTHGIRIRVGIAPEGARRYCRWGWCALRTPQAGGGGRRGGHGGGHGCGGQRRDVVGGQRHGDIWVCSRDLVPPDLQHGTVNMQYETSNMRACNVEHATGNIQQATYKHSTFNIPRKLPPSPQPCNPIAQHSTPRCCALFTPDRAPGPRPWTGCLAPQAESARTCADSGPGSQSKCQWRCRAGPGRAGRA